VVDVNRVNGQVGNIHRGDYTAARDFRSLLP